MSAGCKQPRQCGPSFKSDDGDRTMAKASWACNFSAALLLACPAQAADRVVQMTSPAPLRPDFAAIPKISGPVDAAEQRINAALHRLDKAGLKGVCTGGEWQRQATITMHGPGFLSVEVSDNFYCGGAHPDDATYEVVYDLRTGYPVDWTKLLPASLTGDVTLQQGAEGTRTVYLASAELTREFWQGQVRPDPAHAGAARCDGLRPFGDPPPMRVWLAAAAGALEAMPDIPHGTDDCFEPLVLYPADLRRLGAAPPLIAALEKAHKTQ